MRPLEIETKTLCTSDGTEIRYHLSNGSGPWVVIFNAFGADLETWRHQVEYLGDQCRFVTWDYRGLKDTSADQDQLVSATVADHIRDLTAVLEAEQITNANWLGWSAGVPIMLETLRTTPYRPRNFIAINGLFALGAFSSSRLSVPRAIAWQGLTQLGRMHNVFESGIRRAARWPETVSWLKRMGAIGPTIDSPALERHFQQLSTLDLRSYVIALRELRRIDVASILEDVNVPCLIVIGEKDMFTPRSVADRMARRVSNAEVFVIRGATHFSALEFPELVNLRLEKFFREHGF